jgi:hypothetical protein
MTGNRREVADSRVQLQSTLLLSGLRGLLSVKADLCDCEPVEGIDLDRPCFHRSAASNFRQQSKFRSLVHKQPRLGRRVETVL